ncbi:MAG TPA: GntR family transcriptional regulator [Burkholderiales bacterium]|nr:GntR family transcriptional regulator [Burkholderiales bacterium]
MSKLRTTYARSRVPLYIQVASALRRRIETGQWQVGQQISTLEELEREFEVARVTVRQAVELLQNEGLVHRHQGRGTFVADKLQDKHWLRLEATWESLIASIKDNVPTMIKVDDPPARPRLGDGEGEAAQDYVFLRSVQLKNGVPYALVNLHLERGIYARSPESFLTRTALPILATMKGADIEHAHQTLVIGSADPATAALLKVPLGTPTAECHCVVSNSKGVAIYVAEIIYRNDCVKLHINLLDRSKAIGAGRSRRTERPAAGPSHPKNGSRAARRNTH